MAKAAKAVFAAIASPGVHYECMKAMWCLHWQSASRWFPEGQLWFLHGTSPDTVAGGPHDKAYEVPENKIPGELDKTLLAFRDFLATDADVLIRTNLSTYFNWELFAACLGDLADIDIAGTPAEDGSHFTGCCLVLPRHTVQWFVDNRELLDKSLYDDVAMSKALIAAGRFRHRLLPRLDVLGDEMLLHGSRDPNDAVHVRIKGPDRMRDVATFYDLIVGGLTPPGTPGQRR